ncbi:hypothetical protein SDC9_212715 [bioreactor metagenome]|uniref:Uncharacterized protein n=1 Tax=bioreactor metagenome TaxID=1076179 RepID=A0A645JNI2_9ZZZZ
MGRNTDHCYRLCIGTYPRDIDKYCQEPYPGKIHSKAQGKRNYDPSPADRRNSCSCSLSGDNGSRFYDTGMELPEHGT